MRMIIDNLFIRPGGVKKKNNVKVQLLRRYLHNRRSVNWFTLHQSVLGTMSSKYKNGEINICNILAWNFHILFLTLRCPCIPQQ